MSDDPTKTTRTQRTHGPNVVRFPQSRAGVAGKKPFLELRQGKMAQTLGPAARQATGHWCRYCRGIWYGYLLEVTCPRCGNRHG